MSAQTEGVQKPKSTNPTSAERVTAFAVIVFTMITIGCAAGNFSQTAMNAMLGDVRIDFGVDVDTSQLLSTVYMLVMGITVPVVTYVAKRFSLRTVLNIAWAFLALGAFIDFITSNFWVFLLGRIFQAISTGMVMPVGMAFAMLNFPPNRQGTAMGLSGMAVGFAPNVGPLIGGAFSEGIGWRYFFVVVVVIAAVLCIVTCVYCKKESNKKDAGHLDGISVVLSTLGFGGILLGCSNASSHELTSPTIWASLAVGVIALVLFVMRQKRSKTPLINLAIFKSYRFKNGFILQNALTGSFMGVLLILPIFVTNLWGGTAVDSGLVFIPTAFAAGIFNPLAGILSDRIGPRKVMLFAGIFLLFGSCSMVFIDETTPLWLIATLQGIRAMGISSCMSPMFQWTLSDTPREIVMDGSSFSNTVRQSFASIIAAIQVFLIVFFGGMEGVDSAFGYHLAFGLSALLSITTFLIVVTKVRTD